VGRPAPAPTPARHPGKTDSTYFCRGICAPSRCGAPPWCTNLRCARIKMRVKCVAGVFSFPQLWVRESRGGEACVFAQSELPAELRPDEQKGPRFLYGTGQQAPCGIALQHGFSLEHPRITVVMAPVGGLFDQRHRLSFLSSLVSVVGPAGRSAARIPATFPSRYWSSSSKNRPQRTAPQRHHRPTTATTEPSSTIIALFRRPLQSSSREHLSGLFFLPWHKPADQQ